jgi:DNA polymerase IV
LHGPPLATADALLREITSTTGLPCSGGLARTRLVAKVASDQAKPRGLIWVPSGSEEAFLAPLDVRRIPGIGKVTEAALKASGVEKVGQLAAATLEKLEERFGRWGTALYRKARGGDTYEFFVDAEPKSISHNHTFSEDTQDRSRLDATLSLLTQKAMKRLREAGLSTSTVSVTIRYAGFQTITRARTLREPTHLDPIVFEAVKKLFDRHWDRRRKVRLVGVALSSFTHGSEQLDLLGGERREKLERLAQATDALRDRFGFSKIQFGASMTKAGRNGEHR